MSSLPDLYRNLGTTADASPDVLIAAYRAAARRAHPDTGGSHEQFVLVDFSWRILSDPKSRRNYDLLRKLANAVETGSGTSLVEAERLLAGAIQATREWRIPAELQRPTQELLSSARAWAEGLRRFAQSEARPSDEAGARPSSGATSERPRQASRARSGPSPFIAEATETVRIHMTEWPRLLERIRTSPTLGIRRRFLHAGYMLYCQLRQLQDCLGDLLRLGQLDDQDAENYFHVCAALLEVRRALVAEQERIGRGYAFKAETWLVEQQKLARANLRRRRIEPGQPPWEDAAGAGSAASAPGPSSDVRADAAGPKSRTPRRPSTSVSPPLASANADQTTKPPQARPWKAAAIAGMSLMTVFEMWGSRTQIADALRFILGAALTVTIAWLLVVSEPFRRMVFAAVVWLLRLVWLCVRGIAFAIGGIVGGMSRRR